MLYITALEAKPLSPFHCTCIQWTENTSEHTVCWDKHNNLHVPCLAKKYCSTVSWTFKAVVTICSTWRNIKKTWWIENPTNAVILQCTDTRHSPTCFGTLKCHHQGVIHDPAEIGAQCCINPRWMEAVYCSRLCHGQDINILSIMPSATIYIVWNNVSLHDINRWVSFFL
jgi:hypothetical protein